MVRKASSYPPVIPLETPEIAKYRNLRGSFKDWRQWSEKMRSQGRDELSKWCLRKAYFDSDDLGESFYQFVKDYVATGFGKDSQLDPRQHRKMCKFIVDPWKRKMLLAARGSQKSTIGALGYASWVIGREHVITGKNRLRILFASENLEISGRNMQWVKQMLEWNRDYIQLAGDHKGQSEMWGVKAMMSDFRDEFALAEPTFSPIGIKAGRTGFHYDIIIVDDLMAETYATSAEQIDACDRFFKLLFSMLVQDGTGEFLILGTRWDNDDIYVRIKNRNDVFRSKGLSARQFKILEMPARDKETQSILFPTIYTEGFLQEVREVQGRQIYANQYMLEALDAEDKALTSDHVQYWTPEMLERRKLNIYITVDLAFTEEKSFKGGKSDYTVIMTVGIDEDWNYYVLDWFREQCSKRTAMNEIYRQFNMRANRPERPIRVLLQRFDRSQFKEGLDHFAFDQKQHLPVEWVPYPSRMKKNARIESSLVPHFHAKKVFLPPNMGWFLSDEFYKFPNGRYDDALDALTNVTWFSNPAKASTEKPTKTADEIRVARLKAGLGLPGTGDDSWKTV